jgi:hypothetical protein
VSTGDSASLQNEQHRLMCSGLCQVYDKNGLFDQAQQAKAIGDGAFGGFLKQLLSQYGPLIGPILISLLGGLLHLPVVPVAPIIPPVVPPTPTT